MIYTNSISDRMKMLIESKLPKYGRFKELEKITGVTNATWQTWARGRQRPTEGMIESIARAWPEHAYWLVTSDELPNEGMTNPTKQQSREISTLSEFTARVLAIRITILRDEVTGVAAIKKMAFDKEESIEQIAAAKKAKEFLMEEWPNAKDEDELRKLLSAIYDKKAQELMASDQQYQELERTRNRLIQQALLKEEISKSKNDDKTG